MPCSDERSSSSYLEHQVSELRSELKTLTKENTQLAAILCALLNEVERSVSEKDFTQFIRNAEIAGKVEIFTWLNKHKKQDFNRMERELDKYSDDEIEVIKKVLKSRELLQEK